MFRPRQFALFSVMIIGIILVIALIIYTLYEGGSSLPVLGQATNFRATNITGKKISFSDTTGKIRLVTWFYTNCPDECPLTAYRMEQIQDTLETANEFGKQVDFISVTFDPKRDTIPVLKTWSGHYHANYDGWYFLRPALSSLPGILQSWGVKAKKTDTEYIEHVLKTELIDQNGNIRKEYNTADLNVNEIVSDINNLLSRESWG